MKVKRYTTALVLALGLALTLAWLLAGARVPGAQAAPQNPTADVIYVDADASGPADGLTWSTAFTNVQDALSSAASGDEIWVAEGVYTPGITRTATFQLKSGVALYGGFVATETLRTQRDWKAHVTVLSGDLGGNDVTDANGVVTDPANTVGDNAYNVVTAGSVSETARLDGFTITAGKADGSNHPYFRGGGMFNTGSPTLANITFSGNSAVSDGGGMHNEGNPTLTNITFNGNSAGAGGGMLNYRSSPTLTNVTFNGNSASGLGGGMSNDRSSPTLTNVTFNGNSASGGGGIGFLYSSSQLVSVTFSGNSANYSGGGIYSHDSSLMLTNVTFNGNSASDRGGGIDNRQSDSTILTNVTFSGNSAGTQGGGVCNYVCNSTLTNVTFSDNTADEGGGIYNYWNSNAKLSNAILWGNSASSSGDQIVNLRDSVVTISYSLIQDSGGSGAGWDADLGTDGGGNIDAHPCFVRAPNPGDGDWTTLADNNYGNLRLQPNSPAIDAGDNTALPADTADLDDDENTSEQLPLDLNNQARRFDSPTADTGNGSAPIVDMGAYEQPSRLYVDADTTGSPDGLTWSTAYRNLQPALNNAKPGYEIWVAEGVYVPTAGITRTATFQLKDGVAVYGGFVGGESKRKARDPHTNLTILSGDLDGNDVTDSHGIVTNAANIVGNNAYHVVTGNGLTEATILDGFVITGGKADGSDSHNFGGGMVNNSSNPTLANITFSGNAAGYGGGMHNSGSSPQMVNISFSGNAASYGGGMYNQSNSGPRLTNAVFSGNSATVYGGGMRNEDSNPVLINTTLSGNAAASGGGIYNASGHMTVYNTILWGNTATISGTQIHNASSAVTITHSLVQDSGGSGAGWDTTLGTDGGGNIDADPQFTRDPDPGDGDWTTPADNDYGDLRLLSSSPAIDKGDTTALPTDIADLDNDGNTGEPVPLDRAGKPRIVDIVDMGAYEWYLQVFVPVVLKN